MLRYLSTIFVLLLVFTFAVNAQSKTRSFSKKAHIIFNEPGPAPSKFKGGKLPSSSNSLAWVVVDSMENGFSTMDGTVNPLVYDPYSNVIAFVHRAKLTYASSSGSLFYNTSTDKGLTWKRVAGPINAGLPQEGRYPSMAISNVSKGPIDSTTAGFAWMQSDYIYVGYGAEQPVGAGSPYSALLDGHNFYTTAPIFSNDITGTFFWLVDDYDYPITYLFKTKDFLTVDSSFKFDGTEVSDGERIWFGGASKNGKVIAADVGTYTFSGSDAAGWIPAIHTSTNDGASWVTEIADFRKIPTLNKYQRLYDYIKGDDYVSYQGDINIDKDGYPHLLFSVTDILNTTQNGNAVVEVYKTATGWKGQVVAVGIHDSTNWDGMGGLQMGPACNIAVSKEGDAFVAQWVQGVNYDAASKTYICDIFQSYRALDGIWSAPVNITNTPNLNESCAHLANFLSTEAGTDNYTSFSLFSYEIGNNSISADYNNAANVYIAPIPVKNGVISGIGKDNSKSSLNFSLSQNYPNPFNPSTSIRFSLTQRTTVSLKVTDILGREVVTLLNEERAAGNHQVKFDGSKLSSGVYIYTLKAGNRTESKKLTLMK